MNEQAMYDDLVKVKKYPGGRNKILVNLLLRDGNKCSLCGDQIMTYEELSIDHIIPIKHGGIRGKLALAHAKGDSLEDRNKEWYMKKSFYPS